MISTNDLLGLTNIDQLILCCELFLLFLTKQAILFRRSTVQIPSKYCENFPSEITMFIQSSLFNDTVDRWKQSGEWVEREGEREREQLIRLWSERWSIGQKWKWRGLEMAISEKGHLSFLVKQINRLSIVLGRSQIILFYWCLNICSHVDMFHFICINITEPLPIITV
jgi:hypothetical protein